ncbi:unnamed protein product, partial [Ixodes pacificus]
MFDSMWGSMMSSMQLAEEYLKQDPLEAEKDFSAAEPLTGLEMFARAIETVFCRVKVRLTNTTIRVEHIPNPDTDYGIALEVRIKLVDYFDQVCTETEIAGETIAQRVHERVALSTKRIKLSGTSLYTDEFSLAKNASPSQSAAALGLDAMAGSPEMPPQHIASPESPPQPESDPILISRLQGRQEMKLQLKQDESLTDPNVEVEFNLDQMPLFLSPRQVNLLIKLAKGFYCPGNEGALGAVHSKCKPMDLRDFARVEQDLQRQISTKRVPSRGLASHTGWSTHSLDSDEDYQPMTRQRAFVESGSTNATSDMESSASSITYHAAPRPKQRTKTKRRSSHTEDTLVDLTHFRVRCSALYAVVLHDDIVGPCGDSAAAASGGGGGVCCPSPNTAAQMRAQAEAFFVALTGTSLRDLDAMRDFLLRTVRTNHLRIAATPMTLEGTEKSSASQWSLSMSTTVLDLEVLECIYDRPQDQEQASVSLKEVQFSEILSSLTKREESKGGDPVEPFLRLKCEHLEKTSQARGVREPFTSIVVELGPTRMEVDRSLMDRIYALLHPPAQFSTPSRRNADIWSTSLHQSQEHTSLSACRTNVRVHSPFVKVHLRFPVPDLRPQYDMGRAPWWQRNIRPDILTLELTEPTLSTSFEDAEPDLKLVLVCKDAHVLYQESPLSTPVSFLRVFLDPKVKEDGFDWPRVEMVISPEKKLSPLETEEKEESMLPSMLLDTMLVQVDKDLDSPFATRQVFYHGNHSSGSPPSAKDSVAENDEVILPGDKASLRSFMDKTSNNCRVLLDFSLPSVNLCFPDKHFYEVIYNRLTMDLVLWEPLVLQPSWQAESSGGASIRAPFAHLDVPGQVSQDSFQRFSMCCSSLLVESEDEDDTAMFQSMYENRQRLLPRRDKPAFRGVQSQLVINVTVTEGLATLVTPLRDAQGNVLPQLHGEMQLLVSDGQLFLSACHRGDPELNYVVLSAGKAKLHHKGQICGVFENSVLQPQSLEPAAHLLAVLYASADGVAPKTSPTLSGDADALDAVSVVIKTCADAKEGLKTIKVAVGLQGTTLRHRVSPFRQSWVRQFTDFFDVVDYPVLGYVPLGVVTELHLNLCNCAIDYRPLYIPYQSVVTMENFSISSNLAGKTTTSLLRIIAEEVCLYISDKQTREEPNLAQDYVCVVDTGLFDLTLRMTDVPDRGQPVIDLRASNNIVHVRTCADSCRALQCLLAYFAGDGDLIDETAASTDVTTPENLTSLSQSQADHFDSLMAEAMRESSGSGSGSPSPSSDGESPPSFMRVDSSDNNEDFDDAYEEAREHHRPEPNFRTPESPRKRSHGRVAPAPREQESDSSPDEEFCILENDPGTGIVPRSGEPRVRLLVTEPIQLVENYFTVPVRKTDQLRAPKDFPPAVQKYSLREMSLVWHLYGGSDFGAANSRSANSSEKEASFREDDDPFENYGNVILEQCGGSASYSKRGSNAEFVPQSPSTPRRHAEWVGGPGRRNDVLMELQMNKIQFQHEEYPEDTLQASRQVLLIQDVEIRDRLAASKINKFLYQYASETMPRQSHANMVVVKLLHIRPDLNAPARECSIRVSLKPLRFNIDQDALLFLYEFFSKVSSVSPTVSSASSSVDLSDPVKTSGVEEKRVHFPKDPQLSSCVLVPGEHAGQLLVLVRDEDPKTAEDLVSPAGSSSSSGPVPLFIRSFVFSPDVPIRLDYHGKRVAMDQGALAGLLMGLGQLNCLELTLKRLCYRQGLLGMDKLLAFVLNEWLNDIKKNQLPSVLGGVGPMHSFVQLFNGMRDLVWLPVEQYRRDGRIVRGLQRGANSFTTSTAMACLELTNRMVQTVQGAAELAYDMLSPGPSLKVETQGRYHHRAIANAQPVDIREGVANAYHVVTEGLGDTARTLVQAASQEHRQKGVSGALGGVLRQLPPTVVRPIIVATEATSSVLGGVRNQILPDAHREAVQKWRQETTAKGTPLAAGAPPARL